MKADDTDQEVAARLESLATERQKLTIPDVAPFVEKLYDSPRGSCGCCLHIVLDDQNVADDHVRFCVTGALERQHSLCYGIARCLLKMSKTQRLKLAMTKGRVDRR